MGKSIDYTALLIELDIIYGDGIFIADEAMRKHKEITGKRPTWKDRVPGEVKRYIEKKYSITI